MFKLIYFIIFSSIWKNTIVDNMLRYSQTVRLYTECKSSQNVQE